jgi:hypothetical protein
MPWTPLPSIHGLKCKAFTTEILASLKCVRITPDDLQHEAVPSVCPECNRAFGTRGSRFAPVVLALHSPVAESGRHQPAILALFKLGARVMPQEDGGVEIPHDFELSDFQVLKPNYKK